MTGPLGATRRLSFREKGGDPATFDLRPASDGVRAVERRAAELGRALTSDEDRDIRARAVVVGWDGLGDADGSPIPFSPERVPEVLDGLPALISLRLREAILGDPEAVKTEFRAFEAERRAEGRLVEKATDATGIVRIDLSAPASDERTEAGPDSFRALGRLCATIQRAERAAYMRSRARAPRSGTRARTPRAARARTAVGAATGTPPCAESNDPPPPDGPRSSGAARAPDRAALLDFLGLARSLVAGLDPDFAARLALGFLWPEDLALVMGGTVSAARRAIVAGRFGAYSRVGKRIVLPVETFRAALAAAEVRPELARPAAPRALRAWESVARDARERGRGRP